MLLVRVGEIEFRGHTDRGFLIGPGGFKGWEGAPASRRESGDRPGAHGSFRTPVFKGARLVTLSGTALASSEAEVVHMGDVLAGVGQAPVRVTVTTEAGTRWADGDVEGPIIWDRVGGTPEAAYELSFLFPDPFKYGETQQFVTSSDAILTAHHRGNTAATPRFTVAGTFPNGYALHAAGRVVQVAGSATAISDTVDFRTGMVTRGGTFAPGRLQIGQFWSVPGGASLSWRLDRVGGTGTATMHLTDTFI